MTNGKIRDAEVELELSGSREQIDRLLLVGQKEMKTAIQELTSEVKQIKHICQERGKSCPIYTGHIYEEDEEEQDPAEQTFTAVARWIRDKAFAPILVALALVIINLLWFGRP